MAALPFSRLERSVQKPVGHGFTKMPQTIGHHIRNRRLELGLEQADLAGMFGVSLSCISIWETGNVMPNSNIRPKVVQFLGYVPWPIDLTTFGGKLEQARLLQGLSMDDLAQLSNMAKAQISRFERNKYLPKPHLLVKLNTALGSNLTRTL